MSCWCFLARCAALLHDAGAWATPACLPACHLCRAATVQPIRQWQLVPGTAFIVDRFCNLPAQSPYRRWFLTHFHADHYKGLTGRQVTTAVCDQGSPSSCCCASAVVLLRLASL